MRTFLKFFTIAALAVFWSTAAMAAGGNVIGVVEDVDELELYKAPGDDDPAAAVAAKKVTFPIPILATSKNGMFKIEYNEAVFWVISDDVVSDLKRKVDAKCDPKMAGTVVAHGKRGAGEGCE